MITGYITGKLKEHKTVQDYKLVNYNVHWDSRCRQPVDHKMKADLLYKVMHMYLPNK